MRMFLLFYGIILCQHVENKISFHSLIDISKAVFISAIYEDSFVKKHPTVLMNKYMKLS